MKSSVLLAAAMFICLFASAQEIRKSVKSFDRIIASPRINVILAKGDRESVRLVYSNVAENKINIDVTGKTLRIYLDDARKIEKPATTAGVSRAKTSMYEGASVTAYISFRELNGLEIRGNQELSCNDPIESEAFTLRAYGENEIRLSSLKTDLFKAKLYGENDLRIREGRTLEQKYISYGGNKVDAEGVRSDYIITSMFGEGSLKINSAEEVRIDAFGEPHIHVDGGADINRRLVIGDADIHESDKHN
jgi:hypothetical protein